MSLLGVADRKRGQKAVEALQGEIDVAARKAVRWILLFAFRQLAGSDAVTWVQVKQVSLLGVADGKRGQQAVEALQREIDVMRGSHPAPSHHPTPYTLHPAPYTLHPEP